MRAFRRRLATQKAGFTLLECVIAILVINLTVAGLLKLMSGQSKQVVEIRDALAGEQVLYLRPHEDPLARQLGMPARVTTTEDARIERQNESDIELVLVRLEREVNPAVLRATFSREPRQKDEPKP